MADTFFSEEKYDQEPHYGEPVLYYMICSTGRCWSTLLSSLLINSGVMGVPHEYLYIQSHGMPLIERFGINTEPHLNFSEYIRKIKRYRTTPNGVFGLKAHFNQAVKLIDNKLLYRYFPKMKFVHLLRRDVIKQAVSLSIAVQTNKWTSRGGAEKEPMYDSEVIGRCLDDILTQNARWTIFFSVNDIEPHSVYYEDVIEDVGGVCRGVCKFVGVYTEFDFDIGHAGLSKQGDSRNDEWAAKYRAEHDFAVNLHVPSEANLGGSPSG